MPRQSPAKEERMNATGMVTLQVKAEEVWTATDEGNRFNLLLC